ncbi:HAD-IIIC family phosphatase [Nocardia sp. NPDC059246]|uniref:HAD-IIIC family phosphatase n=1 Tax=unclassified Nocardia TaxID=2637762 RepID=UPI003692BA87
MTLQESGAHDRASGPIAPLRRLRELRRLGFADHLDEVRNVLCGITDPLDLETAGQMLANDAGLGGVRGTGLMVETALVVYGNSTLDALPPLLNGHLMRHGVHPDVALAGFNSWRTDVLSGAGPFANVSPAPVVLVLDDTVVFESVVDATDTGSVAERCAAVATELEQWIGRVKHQLGSLVIVTTVPLSPIRRNMIIDYRGKSRIEAAWARMNAAILDLGENTAGVVTLAHESIGTATVYGLHRMRHIGGVTFAPEWLSALAEEIARVILAHLGRAKKCLVMDLDNTLWGGVVGDDGISALRIGGAYPGSGHLELQRAARALAAQGVILAVASKNRDDTAMSVFADHPEMLLRADDLLARRIDFQPKPGNLRALAGELNIGIDSMVFIDDSDFERGLMGTVEPSVTVVEPMRDPADYAAVLLGDGHFNVLDRTAEDAARNRMYRADRQRVVMREQADDLAGYLLGLDQRLTLDRAEPMNAVRIAQLFGKTNQFNLTGVRYSVDDITRATQEENTIFVCGRLADTFGDSGVVVAAAVRDAGDSWSIENMVLSCRAFARGVEEAMLATITAAAAARGRATVTARFVPTAKNRAFRDFFGSNGFQLVATDDDSEATTWRISAASALAVPAWIAVTHTKEVFDVRQ